MENEQKALNSVSLESITISQDGDLEVTFDLPHPQNHLHWDANLQANRIFDIAEDPELKAVCQDLYRLIKKRIAEPDREKQKIHCNDCAKSACCRDFNVLINKPDIKVLSEHLKISASQFEEKYTDPGEDWTGEYDWQLRKDEDAAGEEKCVFLKENADGRWRCSVYEARPKICRDYAMASCGLFQSIHEK